MTAESSKRISKLTRLFDRNALPDNLADEKTTAEQIRLCFEYYDNPHKETCLE